MLLERSASQADVQQHLCSSGLTTAHPVSCVVVGGPEWPWRERRWCFCKDEAVGYALHGKLHCISFTAHKSFGYHHLIDCQYIYIGSNI